MGQFQILYGDIHNHNACGYGVGSMERSIDIAQTHLDFFAFTGHSSWHDLEPMEGGRESHWLNGFNKLDQQWPQVQRLIKDANRDGEFAAFLGFEWHSNAFGDHCVVFPEDDQPIARPDHINGLRTFCRDRGALMIPHHLAYPDGHRGVNWSVFDSERTPVVEIFSEHGNSEHDRGPYPFFSHSMGGRQTSNTVRAALAEGRQFGFVASTDSHSGFPGAYGEGLMAALCTDLSREAIFEAIWAKRTYALTGDRIAVDFTVDGHPMGSRIACGDAVEVAFDVQGRDEIDVVELIHNGRIAHRAFATPDGGPGQAFAGPVQVRLEWGWGPWTDLTLDRVCDWRFDLAISQGRLLNVFPCLGSGPFDEDRRHRFHRNENALAVTSYTGRQGAYRQMPNHSVVLEIDGTAETQIAWDFELPSRQSGSVSLADIYGGGIAGFMGPYPKESFLWHRLLPVAASRVADTAQLDMEDGDNFVYLRARQTNGHLAWASPVFAARR